MFFSAAPLLPQLEDVLQASVALIVRRDSSFLRAMAEQGVDENVFSPISAGDVDVTDAAAFGNTTTSGAADTIVRDDVEYKAIKKPKQKASGSDDATPTTKKRRGPFEIKFVDVATEDAGHAERSFATGTPR